MNGMTVKQVTFFINNFIVILFKMLLKTKFELPHEKRQTTKKRFKSTVDGIWNIQQCISMQNALYLEKRILKLSVLNQI